MKLTDEQIIRLREKYRMLWEEATNASFPYHVRRSYTDKRNGFVSCLFALRLYEQTGIQDIDLEYITKKTVI